ncbi:MAG: hypothetical protein RIT14_1645 [Pseudomonadota bacterium]|jgi:anti-sigma B factor antagonist
MDFAVTRAGDILVVRALERRLDAAGAILFKDRLRATLAQPSARVVLDLSAVEFLDSSGLGALVSVMKVLGPERPLELAALTPAVDRVLRLTRMDTVFPIHPGVADALAAA